jgi:hypothetical protein
MNCRDFNDRLYEMLDETLDAPVEAAAREHLDLCDDCRRAYLREQTVAKTLVFSLDRASAGLSLRPETGRDILRGLESKPVPPIAWVRVWRWFMASPMRPLAAVVALLAVLLLALGLQSYRRSTAGSAMQATCFIDVPMQTPTLIMRLQNNTIVDASIFTVTVGRADFHEQSEPQSKRL